MENLPKKISVKRINSLCVDCQDKVFVAEERGRVFFPTEQLCGSCKEKISTQYHTPEGRAELNLHFKKMYHAYMSGMPIPEIAHKLGVTRQWIYAQLNEVGITKDAPERKTHRKRTAWKNLSPYSLDKEGIEKQLRLWLVEEKSWTWIERNVPKNLLKEVKSVAKGIGLDSAIFRYRALAQAYLHKDPNETVQSFLLNLYRDAGSYAKAAEALEVTLPAFYSGAKAAGLDSKDFEAVAILNQDSRLAKARNKAAVWKQEKAGWEKENKPNRLNPIGVARFIDNLLRGNTPIDQIRETLTFDNPPDWLQRQLEEWLPL